MRKALLVVAALMVAVVFTGVVRAEQAAAPTQKEAKDVKDVKDGKQARPEFKKLDLSKQQKEQIAAIRKQAKADAEKATTKEDKEKIHKAANLKIRTEVLTDKQRKQLEDMEKAEKAEKATNETRHEGMHHMAPASAPAGVHK
jgi:Spy/CpxP family protein refolding chaperone